MSVVSSDFTKLVTKGVKTNFMAGLKAAETQWQSVATLIPSTLPTETYAWLGSTPVPAVLDDERVPRALQEQNFTLENVEYESTMRVRRKAIDDEQYGQIKIRANGMGRRFAQYIDYLVFTKLAASFTTNCYDGQYMCDSDHADSGAEYTTSQSNLATAALSGPALATGVQAMLAFKDDRGFPLGLFPDTLVVGPSLWKTAKDLMGSHFYPEDANSRDNVFKGLFKLVVTPHISDNDWFLVCTTGPVKPLIWQQRIAPEITTADYLDEKFYIDYQGYMRGAVGFGDWRTIYGSNPS